MNKPTWRFVNQSNPLEQVIVHDEASAHVLMQVLPQIAGASWVMQQELSTSLSSPVKSPVSPPVYESAPAPVQVPAPVAQVSYSNPVPPPLKKSPDKPAAKKSGPERRQQERYHTEFRVILIAGNSCFRTASVDVSLGGMKLKKRIPELFLNQSCLAYVSHEDMRENIEMVCNIVGDPSDPCRIQFVNADAVQSKRLKDWIQKRMQAKRVA